MNIELISFKLCPFVQRAVITLLEKNVAHSITYIDLGNPPDWFLQISPLKKVPVLKVDDIVLFESAVINEYLDETHPPSLLPQDPLKKAQSRAWIEFASNMLVNIYNVKMAKTESELNDKLTPVIENLITLERQLGDGDYFSGEAFSLVDTAFAPAFKQLSRVLALHPIDLYNNHPKVDRWQNKLLARKSVVNSTVKDFDDLHTNYLKKMDSFLVQTVTA